jgi:hypothetical protein
MFENFDYGTFAMILAAGGIAAYLYHLNKKEKSDQFAALYKQYKTLTPEKLDATPDEELVRAVAVNVLAKASRRQPDVYQLIPTLSHGRVAIYSVWLYCHELGADAPSKWLKNATGRFAAVAVDGFLLIGADKTAAALEAVVENPDDDVRVTALKDAVAAEHPLDLAVTYIRENSEEFIDS